jgi:ubiquinone/menaquinone biosynthesis C-methylase UbiE
MAWFKDWFNSPYYHLLYGKRDEKEAEMFMRHLVGYLKPAKGSRMLDLACGKGRYARILNEMGFEVTGLDLSENSIIEASRHASASLHFAVHDMRKPFRENSFDYVFNLFTSFGYFEDENDNLMTLKAVYRDLAANGIFVHDYFNASGIAGDYTYEDTKEICGIEFHINKHVINKRIIKNIRFTDQGKTYEFQEKVSLYTMDDFKQMYQHAGFEVQAVFGDYSLGAFDPSRSERLILISRKV